MNSLPQASVNVHALALVAMTSRVTMTDMLFFRKDESE